MTESVNDLLLHVEDGSCDGSLVWHARLNEGKLLGSPLKYAFPGANIFSNGYSLAQLNQVFALGGNLAVGPAWEEHADYIRSLVELKRELKDALIYGRMLPPLHTTSPDVVATAFEGEKNIVMNVVNTGLTDVTTEIYLPAELAHTNWHAPLTGAQAKVTTSPSQLSFPVSLHPGELQIWLPQGQ
jgi:hypothetical protein